MPFLDNELVALAYRCPDHLRRSPQIALSVINNRNAALANTPTDMGFGTSRLTAALRFAFFRTTFKLDYFNNEGLPNWLAPFDSAFRRIGFGTGLLGQHKYLHYRSWFREKLAGYLHDVVTELRARRSPLWDSALLQKLVTAHTDGRRNYVLEINAVLTLEAVERLLFRDLGDTEGESDDTQMPVTVSAPAVA
jgi:asparagine synthase (glutamine-hydrolysing)